MSSSHTNVLISQCNDHVPVSMLNDASAAVNEPLLDALDPFTTRTQAKPTHPATQSSHQQVSYVRTLLQQLDAVGWTKVLKLSPDLRCLELQLSDAAGRRHQAEVQLPLGFPIAAPTASMQVPNPVKLRWLAGDSLVTLVSQLEKVCLSCLPCHNSFFFLDVWLQQTLQDSQELMKNPCHIDNSCTALCVLHDHTVRLAISASDWPLSVNGSQCRLVTHLDVYPAGNVLTQAAEACFTHVPMPTQAAPVRSLVLHRFWMPISSCGSSWKTLTATHSCWTQPLHLPSHTVTAAAVLHSAMAPAVS